MATVGVAKQVTNATESSEHVNSIIANLSMAGKYRKNLKNDKKNATSGKNYPKWSLTPFEVSYSYSSDLSNESIVTTCFDWSQLIFLPTGTLNKVSLK